MEKLKLKNARNVHKGLKTCPGCSESPALFPKPTPLSMPFAQHASGPTIIIFNALLLFDSLPSNRKYNVYFNTWEAEHT